MKLNAEHCNCKIGTVATIKRTHTATIMFKAVLRILVNRITIAFGHLLRLQTSKLKTEERNKDKIQPKKGVVRSVKERKVKRARKKNQNEQLISHREDEMPQRAVSIL